MSDDLVYTDRELMQMCEEFEYDPVPFFDPDITPVYAEPPKREWVGLIKEEFEQAVDGLEDLEDCWIQIEDKLKDKNGY